MSYFVANAEFVRKMILFVLIVFVFLQSRAIAMGKMDFLGELSGGGGREELVKWAGYGEEKLSTVVIGGRLLCNGGGGANPVSGATMAVVCGSNGRKKVSWVGKGSTDSSGEFLIDVPSHLHAIPNLENMCHVKVVRIPTSSPCRRSCTRNHNKKPIVPDSSIGEGIRSYTTHNIHLTMHASS